MYLIRDLQDGTQLQSLGYRYTRRSLKVTDSTLIKGNASIVKSRTSITLNTAKSNSRIESFLSRIRLLKELIVRYTFLGDSIDIKPFELI